VSKRGRLGAAHLRPAYWGLALWTFLIFYLSSMPGSELPRAPKIANIDKIAHAAIWAGWAVWCFVMMARRYPRMSGRMIFACVVAAAGALGMFDEYHQQWIEGRSCDVLDWVADVSGAGLAAFLLARFGMWLRYGWPPAPQRPRAPAGRR